MAFHFVSYDPTSFRYFENLYGREELNRVEKAFPLHEVTTADIANLVCIFMRCDLSKYSETKGPSTVRSYHLDMLALVLNNLHTSTAMPLPETLNRMDYL